MSPANNKTEIVNPELGGRKLPVLPLLILIVLLAVIGGAWLYINNLQKAAVSEAVAWEPPETDDALLMEQAALQAALTEKYNEREYVTEFRKAVKDSPDRVRNILNDTVKNLVNQKNYNALIDLYDVVVFEYPADENNCFDSLRRHLRNKYKELFELEKVLAKRIENKPHTAHYKLASFAARNRRDIWQAAQYMTEAIKRQEDNQDNYRMLAGDYERCKLLERTIALFEKKKELDSNKFQYARNLGKYYAQMEKKEKLTDLLTELSGSEELTMGQWQILAELYCEAGDYQNALSAITEAYISDSAKMRNRTDYMMPTLAKTLDGLGNYELPEKVNEKISVNEQAVTMLFLAEHFTRMRKYVVEIGNYSSNGRRNTSTNNHNFPAAALVMENLEKSGLRIPDKQQFLYDRLKAMIAHYNGDIPAALEYYGRQSDKDFIRNSIFGKARSRAITQKTNGFTDFLNRKDFPAGNGRISGKFRSYDKPLAGLTVVLRWKKVENRNWYREQPRHPLQPYFYENNQQPPPPGVQAVTNQAGEFVFENMPAGVYDITIMLDNAVINPDEPEVRHRIMGNPPEIKLRDGQRRDLGWIDIVEQIEIIEPESNYIAYDDTLRIVWDWKAPSHLEDVKFSVYIMDRFGPTVRSTATILREEVGIKKYFDFDLEQVFPNADLSIHVSALSPVNRTLSTQSVLISYPKYNGLTEDQNNASKTLAGEMMRVWNSRRYEEFIYRAEKFYESFPDSTVADDTLYMIASAWQNLDNKEMAEKAYSKFFETFPDSPLMPERNRNYNRDYNVAARYADLTGGKEVEIRQDLDNNARKSRRAFRNNPNVEASFSPIISLLSKSLSWTFIILSCVLLIMIIQIVSTKKQ
jgi:tetratricopeptide (TPR) repeat protein